MNIIVEKIENKEKPCHVGEKVTEIEMPFQDRLHYRTFFFLIFKILEKYRRQTWPDVAVAAALFNARKNVRFINIQIDVKELFGTTQWSSFPSRRASNCFNITIPHHVSRRTQAKERREVLPSWHLALTIPTAGRTGSLWCRTESRCVMEVLKPKKHIS